MGRKTDFSEWRDDIIGTVVFISVLAFFWLVL
jgi:hypothetical protein